MGKKKTQHFATKSHKAIASMVQSCEKLPPEATITVNQLMIALKDGSSVYESVFRILDDLCQQHLKFSLQGVPDSEGLQKLKDPPKKNTIKIFTDGSYFNKNGGWAAVWSFMGMEKFIFGYVENTTNNRMEIQGVLESLRLLYKNKGKLEYIDKVVFYSDSQYVTKACTEWLDSWKNKNKQMKNMDLWDQVYNLQRELKGTFDIKYEWIKGHSGIRLNEMADQISNAARTSKETSLKLENVPK